MNALRNWIIRTGNQTAEPSAVRTALAETVEVYRNSERWNVADVMDHISPEIGIAIDRKLRAADLGLLSQALVSGMRFDVDNTRRMLTGIQREGVLTEEETQALLDIGIRYGPEWQRAGLSELPSERDIAAVQATIASEELREKVARQYRETRRAMDAGEALTWENAVEVFTSIDEDSD